MRSRIRIQHALHAFTNTHWPDLTSSQQFWFVCIIYEYINIAHNVCVLLKVDIFALYARCLACCFSLSGIHIAFHGVPFVNVYLSLFSQILMHERRNPASIISLSCGGHLVILLGSCLNMLPILIDLTRLPPEATRSRRQEDMEAIGLSRVQSYVTYVWCGPPFSVTCLFFQVASFLLFCFLTVGFLIVS